MDDLRAFQRELGAWCVKTYGPQTLAHRGLCVAEEAGEVCRAILKSEQGIRPSDRGDLGEELADVMIAALVTADVAGLDLTSILLARFDRLQRRSVERDR